MKRIIKCVAICEKTSSNLAAINSLESSMKICLKVFCKIGNYCILWKCLYSYLEIHFHHYNVNLSLILD